MLNASIARRRRVFAATSFAAGVLVVTACSPPSPWLVDRTAELGVDFRHHSGDQGEKWLPTIMGGGVAVFDADGDGDLDLYFVSGNDHLIDDRDDPAVTNRFYRQESGRFVDATADSGLGDGRYGIGVAVGDADNDGLLDVYVANYGADQLYRNLGDGRFENATAAAGVDVDGHSASATFCDVDRDGWLDLFVVRYLVFDPSLPCFDPAGRRDFCGPQSFEAASSVLLRNTGGGRFEDVSEASGIGAKPSTGLGVVCDDFDGDGWADVFVANDGYANFMWINRGDGRFDERAIPLGVAYNREGDAEAGMGVVAADLDGDGRRDLFLTHLHQETNTLYRSLEEGMGFEDFTASSGLGVPSQPFTGFGVVPIDIELDGDLDLAVVNGRVRSHSEAIAGAEPPAPWDRLSEPSHVFENAGDGTFDLLAPELCGLCDPIEVGRGLAMGDLDRDGDMDLVKTSIEGPARVYLNEAPRAGRWLRVRAIDPALGRDAIGARLALDVGGRRQVRSIASGLGYVSASEPVAHFGLGPIEAAGTGGSPGSANGSASSTAIGASASAGSGGSFATLDVQWPSGDVRVERFVVTCVDCTFTVRRGEGEIQP